MCLPVQYALLQKERPYETKIMHFVMKLAFFIMLVTCLQARADAYSQKITLTGKAMTLEKLCWSISRQCGSQIIFNPDLAKTSASIDIDVRDMPLRDVLDRYLTGLGLTYEIRHNTIIVKKAGEATPAGATAIPPPVSVRGRVLDEKRQPLERVGVQEKGTTNGVHTDKNGEFTLQVKSGQAVLVVKYIGYAVKEVPIAGQPYLEIQLEPAAIGIDSVVVTGFNTKQKKISIVGAISTVSPQELKGPSSTLSSSFAGRLSGVIARQATGEPGSGAQFWIRGVSTYGGTGALIFLNGVEISSGDLNSIDPTNIESFSILKDASSTALYGARGANGVILIETKRGKLLDKPRITGLIESSVSSPTQIVRFTDGVTYMKSYNEALRNDNPYNADRYSQEKSTVPPSASIPISILISTGINCCSRTMPSATTPISTCRAAAKLPGITWALLITKTWASSATAC